MTHQPLAALQEFDLFSDNHAGEFVHVLWYVTKLPLHMLLDLHGIRTTLMNCVPKSLYQSEEDLFVICDLFACEDGSQ